MTDFKQLQESIEKFNKSVARVFRLTSLIKLTSPHNPYYPLVRVMCKLQIIKDWAI